MPELPCSAAEDDLIRRLAAWAAETARETLAPTAAPATLECAEEVFGLPLPPLLRRVYGEIGNGGFGPGFGLTPLFHVGFGAVDSYPARIGSRSGGRSWWPRGVLPVLHRGSGRHAAVDCTGPQGTVLDYSPGAAAGAADTWLVESESLAEWLESWMDGSRWQRKAGARSRALAGPTVWDALDARLGPAG
ncbi:SMI1/KNR4 family protein [Kitasatospora sp. NPDC056446]|uniref:SMI1/KNR4 family protein n=1 Tax=Kitasatospora sp. NPDC056446 TaxID=3345819 RepID=UPI0036C3C54F